MAIPCIRLRGFKKPPEAQTLQRVLNGKFFEPQLGYQIEFVEVPRDKSGVFQGFVTIYLPEGRSPKEAIIFLTDVTIFNQKISGYEGKSLK